MLEFADGNWQEYSECGTEAAGHLRFYIIWNDKNTEVDFSDLVPFQFWLQIT